MTQIQPYTYHCHTDFSDGKNTAEEMISRAQSLGFSEIGISDHLIVHKDIEHSISQQFWHTAGYKYTYHRDFGTILSDYERHCESIRQLSAKFNIKVYIGFEVDYFTYSGWEEELRDFLHRLDYDYIISGNHLFFDEKCSNLIDISHSRNIISDRGLFTEYIVRHFQTMSQSVKSGLFRFLAHADYVRKVGNNICGPEMYKDEKTALLDALRQSGTAMEISTKGLRKIGDFYPCGWMMDEASRRDIAFVISDDAHRVEELAADFVSAEQEVMRHGLHKRLHF